MATLVLGPAGFALGGVGDAGAGLGYVLVLVVLVPVTVWLLRGAFTSDRGRWLVVLAVLYALLGFLYFQGLDDPSWKEPDPEADAFALASGVLHLLVSLASVVALLTAAAVRRADGTGIDVGGGHR